LFVFSSKNKKLNGKKITETISANPGEKLLEMTGKGDAGG